MVASRGGYRMARGRHYAKLSLSNAARLSFSDLCILLFMFLSLCRLCVCVFLCSHWSLVDVPLIFFCPADHVPDWQPRVLLGMVEARSVNVKKTTTTTTVTYELPTTAENTAVFYRGNLTETSPSCFLFFSRANPTSKRETGTDHGTVVGLLLVCFFVTSTSLEKFVTQTIVYFQVNNGAVYKEKSERT